MFVFLMLLAAAPVPTDAAPVVEPTSLGEAIVGFHDARMPPLSPGDRYGGHEVRAVRSDASYVVVAADDLAPLRAALQGDARVRYVEDNSVLKALFVPNDPRWSSQYGPRMMGFVPAWDVTLGSAAITVAVLDTGIQRGHQDFDPSLLLQGYDYVNNDGDPADDCGHGTHVAGTVGAWTDNGLGVAGMAQVRMLPMKVLSPGLTTCSGSLDTIARAVRAAADQGAHVITMSLGGAGGTTLRNAVDHAWAQGAVVIAAAGNDGGCCVNHPAAYDSVIAVSAVDSSKRLASYSSRGPQVEVTAPGSSVVSTYNNGGYSSLSGTSMAAPHVAGAVALALSWNPQMENAEVRRLLTETAEDLGAPGRDSDYGYGLVRIDSIFANLPPPLPGPENRPPVPDVLWTMDGRTVTFDASASTDADGDPLTFSWTIDGDAASGPLVTTTFATNGTYDVAVSVADGAGGASALSWNVTVAGMEWTDPAPEVPTLEPGAWDATPIAAGETRYFKVLVDRPIKILTFESRGPGCLLPLVLCTLDLELAVRHGAVPTDTEADCRTDPRGSGATCHAANPEPGWWFLRLKASEGAGDVDVRATFAGDPGPARPANAAPSLRWGYERDDRNVTFSSQGTADPDGDAVTITWTVPGATYVGAEVQHVFDTYGPHQVTAVAADGAGGEVRLSGIVDVVQAPPNGPPVAAFTATTEERQLTVDAAASHDPEGDALTYAWSFGDGGTASGPVASHTYAADGDYPVTLTVSDPAGATATHLVLVTVAATPDPAPHVTRLENGAREAVSVAAGSAHEFKVYLPPGSDWLTVGMEGASCRPVLGCAHDVDLSVRAGTPVGEGPADCARDTADANGQCTIIGPAAGWWFLRVDGVSGSGDVTLSVRWP